jgi:outer membrane protein OmpA-like peptidoglycan-associated protein/tetratricopeptide (TPR) repeat protein
MFMRHLILIITVGLAIPTLLSAQSIDRAQKQMDKYNYSEAIVILKKAVADDKTKDEAIPMLAECYRMQHDNVNAKAIYAQAIELPDVKPETFYYYAQALQSTGDYDKAREMYQKYAEKNPSDHRGSLFVAHCDSVLGPWKNLNPEFEIKLANNINTAESEFGPAFYDGRLVFASDFSDNPAEGKEYGWTGRGYLNLKQARPLKTGDYVGSMGASSLFEGNFNQEYHDGPATFSADGNTIYFTRSSIGKAKREGIYKTNLLKIYFATKTDGNWGDVKPFFLNSTDYSVGHPALSPDGQTLYFVSDMPGGEGKTDIWMCVRDADGWSQPVNLGPNVNTKENEMFPSVRDDGTLYFSSEGHAGYGALDIFKTSNAGGNWTTPVNLHAPINSSYDDFAIAFAPGDKNGFFSSNRPGGVGNDDIYLFQDKPPLPTYISGLVKDKSNLQPIAGATVFLYNPKTGKVKIMKTGTDGMYKALVENPADYVVKAMMPNFIADCSPFKLDALKPGNTLTASRDLLLDKLVVNKTFRIDNIYYDFDKSNIREDAKPELDKLVNIMKENPIDVELGSHTDSRGSTEYNDKLSQKRAESVVDYIINAGIAKSRITAKGYGEHQLINKCADGVDCTPEEHQANRRTEFKVTDIKVAVSDTDQFDYSRYKEGDIVDLNSLPKGFIMQCK